MVAIVVRLELQETPLTEDPFSVAVNCTVCSIEMVCEDGETVRPVPLMLTVRFVLPLMEPWLAVIVVVPVALAVAIPELLTGATFPDEDFQSTDEEISLLELSPNVPIAMNCRVLLSCSVEFAGVTIIETSSLASRKKSPQPVSRSTANVASAIMGATVRILDVFANRIIRIFVTAFGME